MEVCQQIVRKGWAIRSGGFAYLSPKPFSRELARSMRRAGCVGIDFGVDHGNGSMLRTLGRSIQQRIFAPWLVSAKAEGFSCFVTFSSAGRTRRAKRSPRPLTDERDLARQGGDQSGIRLYTQTPLFLKIQARGLGKEKRDLQGSVKENPDPFARFSISSRRWEKISTITLMD